MLRWKVSVLVLVFSGSAALSAQTATRPIDPVFVRAQALVSDGNGAAGRALIDSMIRATPPAAPLYPQALFWRASLAASAADAESDYKHIVVDFPLTPQAPEALLRLAQLELARGDRDAALGHLQRIPRDYPGSKSLARANYWIARVFFEKNDVVKGCAANASALTRLDPGEIELRNQLQYQGQRCPAPASAAAQSLATPDTTKASSASQSDTNRSTPAPAPAMPVEARVAKPGTVDPTANTAVKPEPLVIAVDAKPAAAEVKKPEAVITKSETTSPIQTKVLISTPATKSEYSVQVAAYKSRADADKLSGSLKNRGYEARVDESPEWFRVRIGRYASESAAEAQLRELKARQMSGFVVRAPDR